MQSLLKSTLLLIFFSVDLHAFEVKRTIFAFWDKPDVVLHYKLPQEINDDTKVLFIIHGQSRNASDYINHWVSISEDKNVLLIAPEFKKADYKYFSLLETATSNGAIKQNADMYLNNSIDSFFTYFKSRYNIQASKYSIFGHSAGGQFAHRYLLYSDKPRVEKAVIANPGWYTFLAGARFPYGITDSPIEIDGDAVKYFLSMRNTLLLGSDDLGSKSLNMSPGAMKQGENRFTRGNNYFNSLIDISSNNSIPFRWNYEVVPDTGHDYRKMSDAALEILL